MAKVSIGYSANGGRQNSMAFAPEFEVRNGRVGTANWDLFRARQVILAHGGDISTESGDVVRVVMRLPIDQKEGEVQSCSHLGQIRAVRPKARVCEECVKAGDTWVHLRLCLICGNVGCCDSSKNKHATRHFHATAHPVMRSIEPGEDWAWCYVDKVYVDTPASRETSRRS
jgi:hypothetical protein